MKPNNNTNKPARIKPILKTLPFIVSGKDQKGNDYDADSALNIVTDLQDNAVFEKLSVMATIAKKIALGKEDARGVMSIARVQAYNADKGEVDLLFFGKNAELADVVNEMVVVPRVRMGRDTDEVATILAFEIVNAMEA